MEVKKRLRKSGKSINDATFHYVDLIRKGLALTGMRDLGVANDPDLMRQADLVVSISCFFAARSTYFTQKHS